MTISAITFSRLRVPLKTPFKTAVRSVTHLDDIVVKIADTDGFYGYGSAPSTPQITGETHETIQSVIKSHVFPAISGLPCDNISVATDAVQHSIVGNTSAKAAVEIALYDVWAQRQQKPLFRALGGKVNELQTDYTISVNDLTTMMKDCQAAIDCGYRCLKIKVGSNFEQDLISLPKLYRTFSGKAVLRLDVNQGWSESQTIHALQTFESAKIRFELVEQPVNYNDIAAMSRICANINTPVMADESATTLAQVHSVLRQDAADIVNIKLMKCGGISQAIAIAELCKAHKRPCMMGCMLEGVISVAAAAHVSAAYTDSIGLIDLDGPTLGQFDPLRDTSGCSQNAATVFDGALIQLNQSAGLGIHTL